MVISIFWTATTSSESNMRDVEYNIKKNIIQAFFFSERNREELEMLKEDMISLVMNWVEQIRIISQATTLTPNTDMYARGVRCLLEKFKWHAELILSKAIDVFDGIIEFQSSTIELRTLCGQTLDDEGY